MTEVLNHKQVGQKITRMAFEIYERNLHASGGMVVAGISGMGTILGHLLATELRKISPLQVEEVESPFLQSCQMRYLVALLHKHPLIFYALSHIIKIVKIDYQVSFHLIFQTFQHADFEKLIDHS